MGDPTREVDFEKFEVSAFAEYGLTDTMTLFSRVARQDVSLDTASVTDSAYGYAASELGVRQRLWKGDWAVISAQTSLLLPGAGENVNDLRFGGGSTDMESRVLVGQSFEWGGWNGFAEAQLGYRKRGDGYADEARLDIAFGLKPTKRFEVMAQGYLIDSLAGARPGRSYNSARLHVSALWWIKSDRGLQAGYYRTVRGKNIIQENAFIVSHWIRF